MHNVRPGIFLTLRLVMQTQRLQMLVSVLANVMLLRHQSFAHLRASQSVGGLNCKPLLNPNLQ